MVEEAQVLGSTQTFEPQWAACSHPGTHAASHHRLPREGLSEASLPSSSDRCHRVTGPQTNKGSAIGSTSWTVLRVKVVFLCLLLWYNDIDMSCLIRLCVHIHCIQIRFLWSTQFIHAIDCSLCRPCTKSYYSQKSLSVSTGTVTFIIIIGRGECWPDQVGGACRYHPSDSSA